MIGVVAGLVDALMESVAVRYTDIGNTAERALIYARKEVRLTEPLDQFFPVGHVEHISPYQSTFPR